MNLNLSKFKKIKEDEKSATLEHPDGHQIVVAKSILNGKNRLELDKLPIHSYEGDLVSSVDDEKDQDEIYKSITPQTPEAPPTPQIPEIPLASMPTDMPSTHIQGPDTYINAPNSSPAPNLAPGAEAQIGAVRAESSAQSDLARQQAELYEKQAVQEEKDFKDYQTKQAAKLQERNQLQEEFKKGQLDPNHLIKNMSVGRKISTAIGLILGGIGGGLTHTPSAALEFLNKEIDNDIESQKLNLGKTKSLLDFNTQDLGSLSAGYQMTKAHKLGLLATKIQEAAAKTADPIARARGEQAVAAIQTQSDALIKQALITSSLSGGQFPVAAQGMLPPDLQKRSVKLPSGKLGLASSDTEAEKARTSFATLDEIDSGLQNIEHLMNDNGRTIPGTAANKTSNDAQSLVALNLRKLFDLNRMSPEQLKIYEELVPAPGDFRQNVSKDKLSQLRSAISGIRSAEMNNFLIGPDKTPGSSNSPPPLAPPNLSGMRKK